MLLWFFQLQRDFTKEDLTLFRLWRERDFALSLPPPLSNLLNYSKNGEAGKSTFCDFS